jgi:Predicted ATPase (AAA+ superfamily)
MTNLQAKRHLTSRLPAPDARRLVLLTGARQVGKTTLARAKWPELKYLNLDSTEDRHALRELPARLWSRSVGPAILDEAQKEPTLFEKLKYAFDARSLSFSVLLGSAQVLLLQNVRETLAGRVFIFELWPLTLAELAGRGNEPQEPLFVRLVRDAASVALILADEPPLLHGDDEAARREAANHLETWGGMPELIHLPAAERLDWLRSYHDTYLQRDLADLVRLRDLEPFHRFQRLAAFRTSGLLSYADLARDAGTSPNTARNYLEYLRLSYQAFLLSPWSGNGASGLVKSPKIFWADLGIARTLTGIHGPAPGPFFESLVVAEAQKLTRTLSLEAELSFYRSRSGLEVDLLVDTPEGPPRLRDQGAGIGLPRRLPPPPAPRRAPREEAPRLIRRDLGRLAHERPRRWALLEHSVPPPVRVAREIAIPPAPTACRLALRARRSPS